MTNIQYNELFNFLVKRFDGVDLRFDKIEERLNRLEINQDFMIGELKILNEERLIGTHRANEIEGWVTKAANKINLPYNP